MGSTFWGTWEGPGGVFFKFAVKRAFKQDQIVLIDGKLQVILYFREECIIMSVCIDKFWKQITSQLSLSTKLTWMLGGELSIVYFLTYHNKS